jgi:DNA polymerase III epsilon subunit family exonuclease
MAAAVTAPIAYAGGFEATADPVSPAQDIPGAFVVFDLETTGLDPDTNEIIEVGAIRVNRDSGRQETFGTLVRPVAPIPRQTTELTGITQDMVDADGLALRESLSGFLEFIGGLPLVSYAADFDMAFLRNALRQTHPQVQLRNPVSCALKMARRAWPFLSSFRLGDLAFDGAAFTQAPHRALGDCERALLVYTAAAKELRAAKIGSGA